MKITTKINLLTTAWMLCILLIINTAVFISFMTITVNMEEKVLFQKADDILAELGKQKSALTQEGILKNNLTAYSFIRIIEPDGTITNQVVSNATRLAAIKGEFSRQRESQRRIIREKHGEEQVIIVRVPIVSDKQVTGTLEIGERLLGLEMRKDILLSILALCTVFAVLLSLLGGRWLSNLIMRPISTMIKTMEDIERSGVPKTIAIHNETKDELHTMATTFNRMIARLQENLEKQKQFISDASHELKTPLTVIKSYANLLKRRGRDNNEIAKEAIEAIQSEANRIQKMTETFLDLATSEQENMLEIKPVNLISLCEGIQQQLKKVYRREITLQYKTDPIIVHADELKLKQVIIILLDNAIKYSKDRIDVFVEKGEQFAGIRVRDFGIGIPEAEIERIFERFYRVDKARTRATGGSGLGLSIAKNIIKMHHGEIRINSNEGTGTDVELLLPLNRANFSHTAKKLI